MYTSISTSGQPVLHTECLRGTEMSVFWSKTKRGLKILCVNCWMPTPNKMRIWGGFTKFFIVDPLCWSWITYPPEDQQNVDLGWIDKIVDYWSSVSIVDRLPPPPRGSIFENSLTKITDQYNIWLLYFKRTRRSNTDFIWPKNILNKLISDLPTCCHMHLPCVCVDLP